MYFRYMQSDWYTRSSQAPEDDNFSHGCYQVLSTHSPFPRRKPGKQGYSSRSQTSRWQEARSGNKTSCTYRQLLSEWYVCVSQDILHVILTLCNLLMPGEDTVAMTMCIIPIVYLIYRHLGAKWGKEVIVHSPISLKPCSLTKFVGCLCETVAGSWPFNLTFSQFFGHTHLHNTIVRLHSLTLNPLAHYSK